ncbi:sugar transferase [Puniceicoccaceae bacterium K14]|nr:sugar transferase [Puniceicoccaceae bacterium K14]
MKRFIDLSLAFLGLVCFFPALLIVGILIRLNLGSPILFKQIRPGLHGKPFELIKFRTMKDSYDVKNNPLPDHKRLTRFGKFLRSTSLDELPELWNVFLGHMSLVGPRPLLVEYLELYSSQQKRRHEVRPGITGWAQINGRNSISWTERFELDVWYVDHRSTMLDFKILFQTFLKVFRREGISQSGQATMTKFRGEK